MKSKTSLTAAPSPISRRTFMGALAGSGAALLLGVSAKAASSGEETLRILLDEITRHPRPPRLGMPPFVGERSPSLPDLSPEYAERTISRIRHWLERLDRLAAAPVAEETRETLEILRWELVADLRWNEFYWLDFPLSPYTSSISLLRRILGELPLRTAEDRSRYGEVLNGIPRYVGQIIFKLQGQLKRRVIVHREQVATVIAMLEGVQTAAEQWFAPAPARLGDTDPQTARKFNADVSGLIRGRIGRSITRLLDVLRNEYLTAAGEQVGVSRYPHAEGYYRYLVAMQATDDIDPDQAHERALQEFRQADDDLRELRSNLGFKGTRAEFHAQLLGDARWRALSPDDVTRWFNAAVERITPHIPNYFSHTPSAPYGVAPLPKELEQSLVNGYYSRPSPANPRGTYLFNAGNLSTTSWVWAAPVIYHELVPGHHFQIATQQESRTLSPYRKAFSTTSYVEGWAEYARSLAVEMKLYDDDAYSRYASRLMDQHFAATTIADTGMHARGWTLDEADRFLADDPFTKATHRRRLALAFAVDFPGYPFTYWHGVQQFRRLRRKAEQALSGRFDIRAFHEAILSGGAMPFPVLERRVERHIKLMQPRADAAQGPGGPSSAERHDSQTCIR